MSDMEYRPKQPVVDVIIPVYRPDKSFRQLLGRLKKQTYPVHQIIVMNTESAYWDEEEFSDIPEMQVYHVKKTEFDHGGTRNQGAAHSNGDIMIFMTDDAVPADRYLVERLAAAFERQGPEGETVALAYGRQLPQGNCSLIERFNREFNYSEESRIKTKRDLDHMGIKTYFASNVCCAYRRDIFIKQGGFVSKTIFNEDMIYAAGAVQAGYAVAYAADARVIHSHNLSGKQQFRRNFDLAVSQADHPEVFEGIPSEGEGIRMVKQTAKKLVETGHICLIPALVYSSGCKYLGYRLGKRYGELPRWVIRLCTSNREYWDKKERNLP